MATKKEYVWTGDSRLIMKCVVYYKDAGGFLFLKTGNGSLLVEPKRLGVDCFSSKKEAINYMLAGLTKSIDQHVFNVIRLQKNVTYLEKILEDEK